MNKKIVCLFCFTLLFATASFSQGVKAYFNYNIFYIPEKGPFIETYISVLGNSIMFIKNENKKSQGSVEIGIMIKQMEEIKAANKYNLLSPEIADTTTTRPNFIDVQRFSLPNGKYEIVLFIRDKNRKDSAFKYVEPIEIKFSNDSVQLSDIQLIESYSKSETPTILTKSGYNLVPYVSNYYPENMNKLSFYTEVYNSKRVFGPDEKFLINYFIESYENNTVMSDYYRYSKQVSNEANVLLSSFDITNLPSGNYNLKVEVKDKNNNIVTYKKVFFQRSAPFIGHKLDDLSAINIEGTFVSKISTIDSVAEYIRSLRPISSESEKTFAENQFKSKDIVKMKQYLLGFWLKRNAISPETAFLAYNKEVAKANKMFATQIKKGYDTERGRVFLQYGAPDTRNEITNEPNSYPYEIWHYQKAKGQTNRRFVFYNTDLASNDYYLLYSDARGEPSDPNWRMRLKKRTMQTINPDQKDGSRSLGGNADDFFDNPR